MESLHLPSQVFLAVARLGVWGATAQTTLVIRLGPMRVVCPLEFCSPQTRNYFGERLSKTGSVLSLRSRHQGKARGNNRYVASPFGVSFPTGHLHFPGLLTSPSSNRTDNMKFLKTSRVCLVTRGRYAGKKVRTPFTTDTSVSFHHRHRLIGLGSHGARIRSRHSARRKRGAASNTRAGKNHGRWEVE